MAGKGSSKECPQATTTYYLKVVHRDGRVEIPEKTIWVEAAAEAPQITRFTVDPPGQVTVGQYVTIRWQVDGQADSVRLTANGTELSRASKGTIDHQPAAAGTVAYLLEAVGPGGTSRGQQNITVVPVVDPITPEPPPPDPVLYAFDVSPNQITVGNCVNISWSVGGGATYVRILRDGAPYWDPTEFRDQFCDTQDQPGDHSYQLLAGNVAKEAKSEEQWVNVSEAAPQNPLAGTHWVVTSLQDGAVPIVADAPPTASFGTGGRLDGSGACMTYGASYRAEGDVITVSRVNSAQLNCSGYADMEARMAQDAAFLDLLPMATNLSLDGDRLLILDPGGMRLMELRLMLW